MINEIQCRDLKPGDIIKVSESDNDYYVYLIVSIIGEIRDEMLHGRFLVIDDSLYPNNVGTFDGVLMNNELERCIKII